MNGGHRKHDRIQRIGLAADQRLQGSDNVGRAQHRVAGILRRGGVSSGPFDQEFKPIGGGQHGARDGTRLTQGHLRPAVQAKGAGGWGANHGAIEDAVFHHFESATTTFFRRLEAEKNGVGQFAFV